MMLKKGARAVCSPLPQPVLQRQVANGMEGMQSAGRAGEGSMLKERPMRSAVRPPLQPVLHRQVRSDG